MPIFTFICPDCGAEKEHICKASERDTETVFCPSGQCGGGGDDPPSVMRWRGVEGSQVSRMNGSYQFKLKDSAGRTVLAKKPEGGRG